MSQRIENDICELNKFIYIKKGFFVIAIDYIIISKLDIQNKTF